MRVCLYLLCGHLLGKGWPLGSRLWCLTVSLPLFHWYSGSGVVLDCIDSWSLHPLLTLLAWNLSLLFYQGDGYLWSHCCMNNLYISHRSLYVPTYSFWPIGSILISLFRVTSLFGTVCIILTLENTSCMNINYNCPTTIYRSIFAQMYKFLDENIYLHFLLINFSRSKWKIVNNTRNTCIWVKILLYVIVHDHANGFP